MNENNAPNTNLNQNESYTPEQQSAQGSTAQPASGQQNPYEGAQTSSVQTSPTHSMPAAPTEPNPYTQQTPPVQPTHSPSPTAALVCGILAIVFCGAPIIGIVLGIIAIVQANKYYRAGGAEGSAKGGKICGIIGIVFSGILIVMYCILFAFGIIALNNYDRYSGSYAEPTYNSALQEGSSNAGALSEIHGDEEQAIYDAVNPYLEQIKNKDPQMVERVANIIESSFNDSMEDVDMDITLQQCGVDPAQLAGLMMDGFDFEQYYVTGDGTEAEANYNIVVRDGYAIGSVFYDRIVDMITSADMATMTEADVYSMIGDALMSAVEATEPTEGDILDVDVVKSGGSWILDDESFEDELKYYFELS